MLAAAIVVVASPPAVAFPRALDVRIGLPLYLSFYGRSADPGSSTLYFAAQVASDVTFALAPMFRVGPGLDAGYASGAIDGVDGFVYSVAVGPIAELHSTPWTGTRVVFGLAVRPGVLFYGAVADENLQKHSISAGAAVKASARFGVARRLSLGASAELGLYRKPLTDKLWFNEELGATNVLNLDIGATWLF